MQPWCWPSDLEPPAAQHEQGAEQAVRASTPSSARKPALEDQRSRQTPRARRPSGASLRGPLCGTPFEWDACSPHGSAAVGRSPFSGAQPACVMADAPRMQQGWQTLPASSQLRGHAARGLTAAAATAPWVAAVLGELAVAAEATFTDVLHPAGQLLWSVVLVPLACVLWALLKAALRVIKQQVARWLHGAAVRAQRGAPASVNAARTPAAAKSGAAAGANVAEAVAEVTAALGGVPALPFDAALAAASARPLAAALHESDGYGPGTWFQARGMVAGVTAVQVVPLPDKRACAAFVHLARQLQRLQHPGLLHFRGATAGAAPAAAAARLLPVAAAAPGPAARAPLEGAGVVLGVLGVELIKGSMSLEAALSQHAPGVGLSWQQRAHLAVEAVQTVRYLAESGVALRAAGPAAAVAPAALVVPAPGGGASLRLNGAALLQPGCPPAHGMGAAAAAATLEAQAARDRAAARMLGAVLLMLLSGRRPLGATPPPGVLDAMHKGPATLLADTSPGPIDARVAEALRRAALACWQAVGGAASGAAGPPERSRSAGTTRARAGGNHRTGGVAVAWLLRLVCRQQPQAPVPVAPRTTLGRLDARDPAAPAPPPTVLLDWMALLDALAAAAGSAAAAPPARAGVAAAAARAAAAPPLGGCFEPPPLFVCPLTHEVMEDPVVAEDGHTYERQAITTWLSMKQRSPMTQQRVSRGLLPNYALRSSIMEWRQRLARGAAAGAGGDAWAGGW